MVVRGLQRRLRDFAQVRDWEQFHSPKNLVMALSSEVGELVELFQWLTPEESHTMMQDERRARAVEAEMADVFSYLLRLADVLGVDLESALNKKIDSNESRYPVELSRGRAVKYDALEKD